MSERRTKWKRTPVDQALQVESPGEPGYQEPKLVKVFHGPGKMPKPVPSPMDELREILALSKEAPESQVIRDAVARILDLCERIG